MNVFKERCLFWFDRCVEEGESMEDAPMLAVERTLWELLYDPMLLLHTRNRMFPYDV